MCINYDLHQSLDDRACFTLHENWRSQEDFEQHLQMPYPQALLGKAEELLATALNIQLMKRIG
ncbi:MAG: antibiotic biosynthesis monooxygenase [Desulfuromonadaceae bacterium]|nr:antibiotic biosynthesis monooxygenase [Desulfuromonadaceae bacterium]